MKAEEFLVDVKLFDLFESAIENKVVFKLLISAMEGYANKKQMETLDKCKDFYSEVLRHEKTPT